MSTGKTAAVVLLGIVLTLTLSVGNVVFAAHATVLDPGFATDTIEEEGGYEALADQFAQGMNSQTGGDANESGTDGASGSESDPEASSLDSLLEDEGIFEDAISPAYVQSQIEPNIYRTYAYLHGNEPRLNLTLDAGPIVENASDEAEAAIANSTTAELLDLVEGDPLADLPIERSTIEMLDEGPDAYAQAQENVRDRVYEQVLDEAVEQAYQERSNDELLALVIPDYDPNDYSESEKEQMVADREDEIKEALHTTIEEERSDELESTVNDRLAALGDDVGEVSTGQPTLDGPVNDLTSVTVEALTTDMSHSTYQSESGTAKADLAAAVGDYVESTLEEEMGSTIDLNEAMEISEEEPFGGSAVSTVGWFDRLALILPLVAVIIVGLLYYLTRSVGRTLGTVGWSMVWVGIPAFVGATVIAGRLPSMLGAQGDPNAIQSLTLGLFQQTIGHLAAQSLALGVVGGLFVATAVGMRYGLHERFLGGGVETADGEAVETQGTGDPLADRGGDDTGATGGSGDGGGGDQPDSADSTDSTDSTASTDSGTSQQDDR